MLKKIFINLTSWQFVTIKDDYKIIIFGPEAKSQLNYFKKNFFYFNLNKNNIFNFKLIFPGIIYFLSLLATRPFILLKYTKLWPKLFFLIAIIKLKKIKKLICLVDYNQWPKIIKMLLGNEVKTIAIQNSFRGYPLYRPTLTKNFDEYFMWSDFNDEEKKIINNKSLVELKIGDNVRLYESKSVGTIDSIKKNKAIVNYGKFTTQVDLEKLEYVQ